MNIGTLTGTIELDDSFSIGLSKTLTAMDQAGKKAAELGANLTKMGSTLTLGVTAPLVGIGLASVKMAMDFNASMANVATLIPGNVARVNELKGSVQRMAVDVGKSTGDLTDGLYQVISAFGDTSETAKILNINARAAAAGMATTRDSIDLTSAVTKGYGDMSAAAVQKASDLAFVTVKLGQTTFPELAGSMGKVIPIASALNVSQEELFGAMATLTGVTGGAAEVTTQLRGVMAGLLKPTEDMKVAIADLGFSSIEAAISQKGLVGTMNAVIGTTDGSVASIGKLFANVESLPAVFALSSGQADVFEQKLAAMTEAAGATDEAFREVSEGVNAAGFQWNQFKSAVQVAGQQLGDVLIPILLDAAGALKPLGGVVMDLIKGFGSFPQPVKVTVVAVLAVVAALGPLLLVAGKLISAWATFTPLLVSVGLKAGLLSKVFIALTGPIGLVVAGSIALYAALKYFNLLDPLIGMFKNLAGVVGGAVRSAFISIKDILIAVTESGFGRLASAAAGLQWKAIVAGAQLTWSALKTLGGWVVDLTTWVVSLGARFVSWVAQTTPVRAAADFLSKAFSVLSSGLKVVWDTADRLAGKLADLLSMIGVGSDKLPKVTSAWADLDKRGLQPVMSATEALTLLTEQNGKKTAAIVPIINKATEASKEIKKALDDVRAATVPLTAAQEAQVLTWNKANISAGTMATALGISEVAVKNFIEATEKLDESLERIAISQFNLGKAAVAATQNVTGFKIRMAETVLVNRDFSKAAMQSQIQLDGFGGVIKRDLIPSLKGMGGEAAQAALRLETLGQTGAQIKDNLKSAFAEIPDIIKNAFTGGGDLIGALKGIATDLVAGVITPLLDKLTTKVQQVSASLAAAGTAALASSAGLGKTASTTITLGTSMVGAALAAKAATVGVMGMAAGSTGAALAAGAMTLGIGAAAVGVAVLIKKWFDHKKMVKENTQAIADFQSQIHATLTAQQLIESGGEHWKMSVIGVRDAYLATGRTAEQAMKDVEALWKSTTISAEATAAAQHKINEAFAEQKQMMQDLTDGTAALEEATKRYGFTIEELGPAMARQELDKQAQQLYKDYQLLTAAGIDLTAIHVRMADSVNDYVKQALTMGVEVPMAMKPMFEAMIQQGTLTDLAGNKITNLEDSGISFAMTMSEGFKALITEVSRLTDAIARGLFGALKNVPDADFVVRGRFEPPKIPKGYEPDVPSYSAQGGLVTSTNIVPFAPRGTDTVPAMLTPGETVLSVAQTNALTGQGGASKNDDASLELAGLRRDLNSKIPKAVGRAVRDNLVGLRTAS